MNEEYGQHTVAAISNIWKPPEVDPLVWSSPPFLPVCHPYEIDVAISMPTKEQQDQLDKMSKEAVKFDQDKVPYHLLSVNALEKISQVLKAGSIKYDAHNWRKGMKWSRLIRAAIGHIFEYMRGNDKDPETGLSHLAHAGCCIMFLLEYEDTFKELDDRYKSES